MRKVMGILLVMSLLVVGVIPALAQGDGTTLNYGDSVLGEITADVYEVFYTFTGSAGDQVVISLNKLQDGLDPYLDLLGPDGSSLYVDDDGGGNLNSLLGPFALPADGTYTIVATRFMRETGGSVGAFRLTLQLAQPTPLTLNEAVTVELSEAQPFAFFSYPGTPDMVFSLSGQGTGDADYNISVRDPQGGYVNSWYAQAGGNALLDPLPLNQAGDYIIVVTRQTQSAMSGATSVTLTMRAVETAPLSFGET
ncbi:MAG: PPC domain-containing protein, partial [Anaerolineae bacterium]|nr:PPC domain-containing protein [Anaerolineae bacterium]